AHRLIEEVIGRGRAEGLEITQAKALDRLGGKLKFGNWHEVDAAELIGRALALRIEAADSFERIAEEIEPHRPRHSWRIKIDNAAADGIIAGFAHGWGSHEAVELKPAGDAFHGEQVAGRGR